MLTRFEHVRAHRLLAGALLLSCAAACKEDRGAVRVPAVAETDQVPAEGDAADDPAVWIDPAHPERSLILGTNKDGGLGVYDLEGRQLQYVASGKFNNVDVLDDVAFAGTADSLVAASETRDEAVVLFQVDAGARRLVELARFSTRVDPSGLCLYRDAASGRIEAIVSGGGRDKEEGKDLVERYALSVGAGGAIGAEEVTRYEFASECEGLVADHAAGVLYVAEEHAGVWRIDLRAAGAAPELVLRVAPDGEIHQDAEGLALVPDPAGSTGLLVVSSQGSDDFVVFRRGGGYPFAGRFRVFAEGGADPVTHTDGIDIVVRPIGPRFPRGVFVAQDDWNNGGHQNFKIASWAEIEARLDLR